MFSGGDIFPSGHTANAVVTWGILAYLATTPRARRVLSVVAAVFALGVGATTVYLGTHWVSDVLLGWAAGLVILLGLPWFEPAIASSEVWLLAARDRFRERRGPVALPLPAGAVRLSPVARRGDAAQDLAGVLEPVGAAGRSGSAAGSQAVAAQAVRNTDTRLHHARPHITRSERTPVTPTGSRRPPHSDRTPRTAPLSPAAQRGRAGG
jgi:hypothetical protein